MKDTKDITLEKLNKKTNWLLGGLIFTCLVIVVLIVLILCNTQIINADGWKDGWGSFLGALLGVFVTLSTFLLLYKQNKNIYKKQLEDTQRRMMPWLDVELVDKTDITTLRSQRYKDTRNIVKPIVINENSLDDKEEVYIRIINHGAGAAIIKDYGFYLDKSSIKGRYKYKQFLAVDKNLVIPIMYSSNRASCRISIIIVYDDVTGKEYNTHISVGRLESGIWITAQKYDISSKELYCE